ncbi:MAG: deoxycytidylate deaminase [Acidimicrobiales bacterium]
MIEATLPAERLRRDRHFLELALKHSDLSRDPETRVGAVIVGPDGEVRSMGYNRFPDGIEESDARLNDRELKLRLMVHAELVAIVNAARAGIPLQGCTLYFTQTDDSGLVWGGVPCTRCTDHILMTGIAEVISYPTKRAPSKWHGDWAFARELFRESGLSHREIEFIARG